MVLSLSTFMNLEEKVKQAIAGDKSALEAVIIYVQDDIYYLALRMLANPDDARDATQEILIKLITKLSTFKFQSQFKTWAFRVAANYLMTEKKILAKIPPLTFDTYQADLESDLQDPKHLQALPEYPLMLDELRISCTMAMLLCLNSSHRMAYILGEIFELNHQEASDILNVTQSNYRKKLSRARSKIIDFMNNSCGLVQPCAKCHCDKKLNGAVIRKRVNIDQHHFANSANTFKLVKQNLTETQKSLKAVSLQKAVTHYKCPIEFGQVIEALVVQGIGAKHFNQLPG